MTDVPHENDPENDARRDRSGPITVLGIFAVGVLILVIMIFSFRGFEPLDVDWKEHGWIWNPTRDE